MNYFFRNYGVEKESVKTDTSTLRKTTSFTEPVLQTINSSLRDKNEGIEDNPKEEEPCRGLTLLELIQPKPRKL